MSAMNNERNPHTIVVPIGALAGAASKEVPAMKALKDFILLSASIVDGAGVSASNSNYITATLKNHTDTLNLATLDTRAANQGALAALEGGDMALVASTAPQLADPTTILPRGKSASLSVVSTGTAALTNAVAVLVGYYL